MDLEISLQMVYILEIRVLSTFIVVHAWFVCVCVCVCVCALDPVLELVIVQTFKCANVMKCVISF